MDLEFRVDARAIGKHDYVSNLTLLGKIEQNRSESYKLLSESPVGEPIANFGPKNDQGTYRLRPIHP